MKEGGIIETVFLPVFRRERPVVRPSIRKGKTVFSAYAGLTGGIPFTVFGEAIGLEPLPAVYFAWLFAMTGSYLALVTLAKKAYIRKYREWL